MTWWTRSRTVKAALAGFALYFVVAGYLKYSYLPHPHEKPKFLRFGSVGYSYILNDLELDQLADSVENNTRSSVMLFEDGKPLGPPHSAHADIRDIGEGRFSHWRGIGVIFSASDNSDPNTNRRLYTIKDRK
jgi:hypothetical protein